MANPPVDHIPAYNWSGKLNVASREKTRYRNLPADKVILPDSLLQDILNAASISESGALGTSSDQSPLMFRLSTESGNVVYCGVRDFSGADGEIVLSSYLVEALGLVQTRRYPITTGEPPAREDPPENGNTAQPIQAAAGDNAGSNTDEPAETYAAASLSVQLRQPPKGTFARLRPLASGYNPGDWKPLLERELKTYTTLTKGATVSVPGTKGEVFRFLVDALEPEGYAICLIDVDLAIDIVPLDDIQARETYRQATERALGHGESSPGGLIEMWKSVVGAVAKGSCVVYELNSWIKTEPITISLECEEDGHDIDLFVSPKSDSLRDPPDFQTYVFADMSSRGSKAVTITPSDIAFNDAESVRIAIGGYVPEYGIDRGEGIRRYTVQVLPTSASKASDDVEERGEGYQRCDNCKRWISPSAWINHSVFCARNNVACPQCFKVWNKNDPGRHAHWHCDQHGESGDTDWSQTKHTRLFHDKKFSCCDPQCSAAGKMVTLPELAKHRTTECAGKLHLCQFCHLELPQGQPTFESELQGLTAHELTEGNKTQHCDICGKLIMLRMMRAHVKNHDIERDARPRPQICRTALCGRTIHGAGQDGSVDTSTRIGQGPGNDIGLCSLCFAKLYAAVHDPENRALRSRIERRYLQQLTKGCGKAWCQNEWCKTGSQNSSIIPKANNLTDAMKVIKPLVNSALDKHAPAHFCVDQTSQAQKVLAKRMAGQNIWELEWTVAACEAEKGNEAKAWNWLQRYAPIRHPSSTES